MLDKLKRKESSLPQQDPGVKRQRVSRACDQCRAAREKCDGIQPSCFTCVSSNRACSYTTPPKKRGIQPGYIRTLELTVAWLFENIPESEKKLHSALSQDSVATLLTGKDDEASSSLHKVWRKSASCRDLERLLGVVKSEPEHEADATADDAALRHQRTVEAGQAFVSNDLSTPLRVKLPHNYWRLLDIYFAYTHTWLPIVQKHEILRLTYAYGTDGLDMSEGCDAQHAELWAMFAIAATQDEVDATLRLSQRTSPSIYDTARRLIPDERQRKSIGHVKALLLLVIINIGAGEWTAAWLLLGQAISTAVDLDLHKPHPSDTARSKHTVLACFVLEVLLCAYLDHAPRLSSIDIAALGPVDEEGLEEWHPWAACDGFGSLRADQHSNNITPARVPTYSMSILNQIVMLSNSIRIKNTLPLMDLPKHLRDPGPGQHTPQLLHLHILHACCIKDKKHFEQLMSDYIHQFGPAALPAIFRLYALLIIKWTSLGSSQSSIQALENLSSTVARVYSKIDLSKSRPDDSNSLLNQEQRQDEWDVQGPGPPASLGSWDDTALLSPSESRTFNQFGSTQEEPPSMQGLLSKSGGTHPLQKYPSNSIDVDALFDELASLDCAENANHHPMFMQNLGLVPNTDLNEVLGFDFGFNPLLSNYGNATERTPATAFNDPGA